MNADMLQLTGVHHVSTLSANIARSHDFYTRVLGLRLLIKTVNQDAPQMYHLFFGDGAGTPGSDITIFDMPHATSEIRGNNAISLTTFRVAGDSAFPYWVSRFDRLGVTHSAVGTRDGRAVLDFEDFEGTQLSLIDDSGVGTARTNAIDVHVELWRFSKRIHVILDQSERVGQEAMCWSMRRNGDLDVAQPAQLMRCRNISAAPREGGAHAPVNDQ